MPFVNQRSQLEQLQNMVPYEDVQEAGFGDVFAASVGMVIDEELSISGALNREGWADRRERISELIEAGQLDRRKYLDRRGRFDYDRAATDINDPNIKTGAQLSKERNDMLAQRRAYAEDVIERGSGMAQFLGMASSYMLDPVNIATMGIGTGVTAAKSLSVAGRALMTARNTAGLTAATELAIQPFVYEHKIDIGSPFSYEDAIQNIGMAALTGGVLGGIAGGLSGYFAKTRKALEKLSDDEYTIEVEQAEEYMIRMEQTLSTAPDVDMKAIEDDFIAKNGPLTDASRKQLEEIQTEAQIKSDMEYLMELEKRREEIKQPTKTKELYDDVQTNAPPKATATERQRMLMKEFDIADDFDLAMDEFNRLETRQTVVDGNIVDADAVMKELDDQLDGLESILVCARG